MGELREFLIAQVVPLYLANKKYFCVFCGLMIRNDNFRHVFINLSIVIK